MQENCIDLVGRIADRGAEFVPAREWMRICFELLDMLKVCGCCWVAGGCCWAGRWVLLGWLVRAQSAELPTLPSEAGRAGCGWHEGASGGSLHAARHRLLGLSCRLTAP